MNKIISRLSSKKAKKALPLYFFFLIFALSNQKTYI